MVCIELVCQVLHIMPQTYRRQTVICDQYWVPGEGVVMKSGRTVIVFTSLAILMMICTPESSHLVKAFECPAFIAAYNGCMPYNEGYQQGLASQDPIYCAGFDAGVIMADQEQIAATASSSSTNSQGGNNNPQQQSPLQLHAGLLPGQAGGPGSSASALGSAIIASGLK